MSRENVELVRSVHPPSGTDLSALFRQAEEDPRGFDEFGSLLTDDFEAVGGDLEGGRGLAAGGAGIDGLLAAWREWLSPWETYWTEVEDFLDVSEDRVLVLIRDHGRLAGSDSEIESVSASVWTLRDGKIARIEFFSSRSQALKAVGLEA
jgi:ketosteroid isomerase-like protein